MTVEKELRPVSPVHVHVENDAPVYVHVKKEKLGTKNSLVEKNLNIYGPENIRTNRSKQRASSVRSRSHSPSSGPWIPPPAKTSKGNKVNFQVSPSRLDANSDYSTEDEVKVHTHMKSYEKKIDSLMSEVGILKNEVELQRTLKDIEKRDLLLETTLRQMEKQEEEIQGIQEELNASARENRILRKNVDLLQDEADASRTEKEILISEKDKLMRKLIEVELDGQVATKQVGDLYQTIKKLKEETWISTADSLRFSRLKDTLREFEAANQSLRRLLRDRHKDEADAQQLSEQKDLIMKRLRESERDKERFQNELFIQQRLVSDLKNQVSVQKEENIALTRLQNSLETTRGHLQRQLRNREADCNRMAVQIQSLENKSSQEKIEREHLEELLAAAKDKSDKDKEALKKATRALKQRASRSEDAMEQLHSQLLERESHIADINAQLEQFRLQIDKGSKEKIHFQVENTALKTRMDEMERLMNQSDESLKTQINTLTSKLHEKTSEATSMKLENEKLKSSMVTFEAKLGQAEGEITQLRSNLRQYEQIVDEYKNQMNRSRQEADDTLLRLEEQQRENNKIQRDGEQELEKVKMRLHQRLQELEPLPELLKSTELQLQDSNKKVILQEKKNNENTKLIAELTSKVEQLTENLEQLKDKWYNSKEENRIFQSKLDMLERKLQETEEQNRELVSTVAKREETIHQNTLRLEEKSRENCNLTRQLENALCDIRRQTDQTRDRVASKERTSQARIMDLESQLSQTRVEIARVKREKEENERKFNSRLYDLKDRLEQSHSTNRSMQNYVQFLKNSYANVFGDSALASPLRSALM